MKVLSMFPENIEVFSMLEQWWQTGTKTKMFHPTPLCLCVSSCVNFSRAHLVLLRVRNWTEAIVQWQGSCLACKRPYLDSIPCTAMSRDWNISSGILLTSIMPKSDWSLARIWDPGKGTLGRPDINEIICQWPCKI